jgi:hypothetical protein
VFLLRVDLACFVVAFVVVVVVVVVWVGVVLVAVFEED